jgi:hypothetical protein
MSQLDMQMQGVVYNHICAILPFAHKILSTLKTFQKNPQAFIEKHKLITHKYGSSYYSIIFLDKNLLLNINADVFSVPQYSVSISHVHESQKSSFTLKYNWNTNELTTYIVYINNVLPQNKFSKCVDKIMNKHCNHKIPLQQLLANVDFLLLISNPVSLHFEEYFNIY